MPFLKNIQFAQLIKIDNHLKEFNFRKSNANTETMFTVDTMDNVGNRIVFMMNYCSKSSEWKLIKTELPSWILENETRLNKVIQKELPVQEIYFADPSTNHSRQLHRLFNMFGIN